MADGFQPLTVAQIQTPDGIAQLNNIIQTLYNNIAGDGVNVSTFYGVGSPEGVVTAGIGSIYLRTDGSTNTSLYRKESGIGNTGWVATSNVTLPLSVANGGLGVDNSTRAQGSIFYFSATGVVSVLAPGTSGYSLTSQGSGANPIYALIRTFPDYAAGAYVIISSNGASGSAGSSPTKLKEIILSRNGTLSTSFKGIIAASNQPAQFQIYRNGSAVGTLRTMASIGNTTWTEDISGWTRGDLFQIYANYTSGVTTVTVSNLVLSEAIPLIEQVNLA